MFSLNCKGKLVLIEKPLVMGILNLTNDSFYAGSRQENIMDLHQKAAQMVKEGADILDLGAQSTRPGSTRITTGDELKKLLPALEMLNNFFPGIIISVDTYHSVVAKAVVENGASIINDISAGEMDKKMIETVGLLNVPYVAMHMKGVPETMQKETEYEDVTKQIFDFFINKIDQCRQAGIKDIILDPGFGFGKNISGNFLLLKNLSVFKMLGKPLLAGLSRKSTIYRSLHITAEESLNGSTVLNTLALNNGASILRVHDVKEAKEAVSLFSSYIHAR